MSEYEIAIFAYVLLILVLNGIAVLFYFKSPAAEIKQLSISINYFRNFFLLLALSFITYGVVQPNPNPIEAVFVNSLFLSTYYCLLYGFATRQSDTLPPLLKNKWFILNWIGLITINVGLFTIYIDDLTSRAVILATNIFAIVFYTLRFVKRSKHATYGEKVATTGVAATLAIGFALLVSLGLGIDDFTLISVLMIAIAATSFIIMGSTLVMFLSDMSNLYYKESIIDDLTGLYNRRYFWRQAEYLVKSAERHHFPISLIMADLDHFKRINDEHGHQTGDMVLKEFANVIKNTARESDISARFGGEEFIIILPQTDTSGALALAERMRFKTETMKFNFKKRPQHITASFGVVSFDNQDPIEVHVKRVDAALYEAKNLGRNRVFSLS